ncbi:hypothetical protein ACHAWF_003065 [Thalassiosira exigua]
MSCHRPSPPWSRPPHPRHAWRLEEVKHGQVVAAHSLGDFYPSRACVTFGRIADDPSLVDVVTAHESCSRLHARVAFDRSGTPWLRDLGSGNGTFVNGKRLPPEACWKGEENDSGRRGSRGVVLYPGDAIRFGASTRVYILEGPKEFERSAIKLKRKLDATKAAAGNNAGAVPGDGGGNEEATPTEASEEECSWGMASDAVEEQQQEPQDSVRDHSDAPLPSMDNFFSGFSTKYKIPPALQQLYNQFQSKSQKLDSIQRESQRILQKQDMGVELTEGQRRQLDKNQERIGTLEKEVHDLKEHIEDGMHTAIHGKERTGRRSKEKDIYEAGEDDDVDDFYDRTATSSKRQRTANKAESEQELVQKWKSFLEALAQQQSVVARALDRCAALQKQIDSCNDDEDAFFLKNDLALANDNLSKAKGSVQETSKELDEVEYLLKVVNSNLVWDRSRGLIGRDIEKAIKTSSHLPEKKDAVDVADEGDMQMMPPPPPVALAAVSLEMPPPPPKITASSEMPPPAPVITAVASEHSPTEQQSVIRTSKKPKADGEFGDRSMVPPPGSARNVREIGSPGKKMKQIGPMRPPARVQGTLAALKQAVSQPADSRPKQLPSNEKNKTSAVPKKFDPRKDEWKAPCDQDGSGRTSLHDKFKGRY